MTYKNKEQMVDHLKRLSEQAYEQFENAPDDDVETAMYHFGRHDAFAVAAIELDMFLLKDGEQ